MTYARQRLWLGITGVGGTVLLCTAAVTFNLPHRLMHPLADQTYGSALSFIALTWMLHAALLLPVDLVGGLVVVREKPGVLRWIASWLRGVTVQWLWFTLAAALLLRAAQQFGVTAAIVVFILLQVILLSRQGLIAWLVGGVHIEATSAALAAAADAAGIPPSAVRQVRGDDQSFVGGWTGLDAARLWVPERWIERLSPQQLAVALTRRGAVRMGGLRRRGVLVALAWNTVGFVLASSAPHADLVTAAGFVAMMAWFTLWSFLGVLVLPSLSRPAVLAADAFASRTHDPALVGETISMLDQWQDDEPERDARVETVFHPVPSRGARLRALAVSFTSASSPAAWHATRMMLYLSWAGLGGLARAVHCNVGRPPVWVMLPGD